MTPLQRWIVRRSGYPFTLPGKQLGTLVAVDATAAAIEAAKQFSGPFVVEPEHRVNPELERVVAKAVKSAARKGRRGHGFTRRSSAYRPPDGDAA